MKVRGIRGAITVEKDEEQEIVAATERLIREMIKQNQLEADDVASAWLTVTPDLCSTFPAKALRLIEGWRYVPVMCATEIPVPKGLARCIRVMFHVHTQLGQADVKHVYLEKAVQLRPDLFEFPQNAKTQ